MHTFGCMPASISITKCVLVLQVNFTITSAKSDTTKFMESPSDSIPEEKQWYSNTELKNNLNVKVNQETMSRTLHRYR